ncbi:MAG: hypothetical protein M3P08_07400 [Thermoproteota archaeon]|nr:hypothetical protein [Thermoproteota archaeon]
MGLLSIKERGRKKRYIIPLIVYAGLTVLAISGRLEPLFDTLALLSLPLIVSVLVYNRFFVSDTQERQKIQTVLYVNYLAVIGTVTGIISIIITTITAFYSLPPSPISILGIPNYAHGLYALFSSSCPILIFLVIFCVPVKLVLNELGARIPGMVNAVSSFLPKIKVKTKTGTILIFVFMLLSMVVAIIPHIPVINKTNQYVGTDTHFYVGWQNNLTQSKNFQQFAQEAFVKIRAGDRPVSLLFIFALVKTLHLEPSLLVDNLSILLAPALVLVVYFLTRELTSNEIASLLSAFLTAISSQTLIGIYAGFYANWFALIIGYLSFVFLFRFLKAGGKANFAVYSTLMILLLFSHANTWTIFAIVSAVFLMVLFKLNYYSRKRITLLLLVVLSSVVIDVGRTGIVKHGGGIGEDIGVSVTYGTGLEQFAQRWSNLVYATQVYLAGQFSNPIILILGLYWLFRSKLLDESSIFLVVFLSLGVLPLFIGGVVLQARVFYEIPFQIPAAIALTYIMKQANGSLLLLPIGIWLVATSIGSVSNFYFVSP